MLIGAGLAVTVQSARQGAALPVAPSHTLTVAAAFLLASLLVSLVLLPLNRFNSSRRFGFVLLALYVAAIATAIILFVV